MKTGYTSAAAGLFFILFFSSGCPPCPASESTYKIFSQASVSAGYDTNPTFSSTRKGDVFEEFLYSLAFIKPLTPKARLTLDYDFDTRRYGEATDASFLLHHLRLELQQRLARFTVGGGYDGGYSFGGSSFAPADDDSFLLHKVFLNIRQNLTKRLYHQLEGEWGYKVYTSQRALGDNIFAQLDQERADRRFGIEYSLGSSLGKRSRFVVKAKFLQNDSNVRYIDFYDYNSYQFSGSFDYLLLKDLHLVSQLRYLRTNYSARTVVFQDYRQKDNLYTGNVSLRYALDKHSTLLVYYTYRTNQTNEPLEKFSQNVAGCVWQYLF